MLREIANAAQKVFRRRRAYVSGERRLLACSVWQLAKRTSVPFTEYGASMFAASCRELQAGSLCSPEGRLPHCQREAWLCRLFLASV
jgi:hypothetical protein